MGGWSTVPCSPCPTDRTALRATTLPAIECACAWGATHRGYCAGRSQSGAWALTSYQWGLAWVGRKLGWVQGTDVTPFALDMSYPRTRVWRPGTAALSRPSWRRGNFHRCWPISTPLSPAREYTSSAPAYMLPPLEKMFCSGISVQPATFSSPVSHGRPVTCLLTCSDACGEAGMFSSSADVRICRCRIFIGNKRYMEFCNN